MDIDTRRRASLRGKIAEAGYPAYLVAARAGMHPDTLSKVLRGHMPLTPAIRQRVLRALDLLRTDPAPSLQRGRAQA
jgi:DNA-binding LacI/PurR family transcriptional regulator